MDTRSFRLELSVDVSADRLASWRRQLGFDGVDTLSDADVVRAWFRRVEDVAAPGYARLGPGPVVDLNE
jgi:hypothetical protein